MTAQQKIVAGLVFLDSNLGVVYPKSPPSEGRATKSGVTCLSYKGLKPGYTQEGKKQGQGGGIRTPFFAQDPPV